MDEKNLARIEYYFAEMLFVLEMPIPKEWIVDLVPTARLNDPQKLFEGKLRGPTNLWFIGTANNDASAFTITDKVYDRAIPIEINSCGTIFEALSTEPINISIEHLEALFAEAKAKHSLSEASLIKLEKLDSYMAEHFKLQFGNRIMKQIYDFVPVYVACGGTELEALDYLIARKILKKFESLNIAYVRDEIKDLISFMERNFGKTALKESKAYLQRIQNLF